MYPILSCTGDRIFRCCVHAFGMFFCSLYGSRPNAVLCGNALTGGELLCPQWIILNH